MKYKTKRYIQSKDVRSTEHKGTMINIISLENTLSKLFVFLLVRLGRILAYLPQNQSSRSFAGKENRGLEGTINILQAQGSETRVYFHHVSQTA